MPREINIFSKVRGLKIAKPAVRALITTLDSHYQLKNHGALSIIFVSHKKLAQMHDEFCGDPSPTDIITFPSPAEETDSFGELYISPQSAKEFIKKHGGTFESEMRRYVIHGYLHLLGYDDLKPKLKQKMRREEKKSLKLTSDIKKIFTFKALS